MTLRLQKTNRLFKTTLIAFVILVAVISPAGAGVAQADWITEYVIKPIGGGALSAVSYILAEVVRVTAYAASTIALRVAGFVFDSVVPFSLGVSTGTTSVFTSSFIAEGWGLMRDITNMVFIFAMLYIAIATILQLGAGRNTRAFIVSIIIIALVVNFSLFLAQVVIDGANLLALEFYRTLSGASEHGIAAIILSGFNPQILLDTRSFESWVTETNQNYGILLLIYAFGAVIQFVGAYVIFWASFLFLGRIVILWLLMILSPLAFAAYILPSTRGKFTQWWNTLLNQAFVAPIFLFFFYILALFIQSGLSRSLAAVAAQTGEQAWIQGFLQVALGFSLVVAFMIVAIRMTKKLGGEAAAWATKISGTAIGFAAGGIGGAVLGAGGGGRVAQLASMIPGVGGVVGKTLLGAGEKAGRVAGAPLRVPLRSIAGEAAEKARGAARERVGEIAKKAVEEGAKPTTRGALLRNLGIARGAARVEEKAKAGVTADIENATKDLEKLSNDALKTEYGYALTTPEKRAAIIGILGKRGKLKPNEKGERLIDPESISETLKTVKGRGYDTGKEIEDKYLWQYAKELDDRKKAAGTLSVEALKEIGKTKIETEEIGPDGKKKEVPSTFFDDKEVFDIAVQNMTSAHFKALLDPEVRSDFNEKFIKNLTEAMEREKPKFIEKLKKAGRDAEAKRVELPDGFTIEDYFKTIENTRGASAIKDPSLRGFFAENNILYKKREPKEGDKGGGKEAGAEEKKKGDDEEERAKREKFYQDFFDTEKKEPGT